MEGAPREVHAEYMAYMSEKADLNRKPEKKTEKTEPEPEPGDAETGTAAGSAETGEAQPKPEDAGETEEADPQKPNGKRWGSREAEMTSVEVLDPAGNPCTVFDPREDITVRIRYRARIPLDDVVLGLAIYRTDGTYIYGTNSILDRTGIITLTGTGTIDLAMRKVCLNQGEYAVDLALHRPDGFSYDFWRNTCTFRITEKLGEVGIISLDHTWQIREGASE